MKRKGLLLVLFCILLFVGCAKKDTEKKNNANPTQATTVTQGAKATEDATTTKGASVTQGATTTQGAKATQNASATKGAAVTQGASDTKPTNTKKISMNIAALKGPTAIGMVMLMNDTEDKATANNYKFTVSGTADEISAGLLKGKYDIAAIPCNLASVLYNKTKKIKVAGINTLGVLYIVESGKQVNTVKDLKGKTIYSTGLGTTPQYALEYILKSNGIDPKKDVKIEYKSEPTEVAAILSKSKNAIAMLPQPYVTAVMMQNKNIRISLSVADEWQRISYNDSTMVTGVVVVRSDFLKNHKAAVDAFMSEYYGSQSFVNERPDIAAKMVEKYGIFKAAPMKKAIPYCNITLIQGTEMQRMMNAYLSILKDLNAKSIGGQIPDKDFYYFAGTK